MLFRLDDALLDRAQSVCDRVQSACGLTCYWLARCCHLIAFGSVAAVASRISGEATPVIGAILCFACMYCFMVWNWYAQLQQYYDEGPDTAHWVTLLWRTLAHTRLMNMLLIAGVAAWGILRHDQHSVLKLAFVAALCFWTVAQYLQCCVPQRPTKSRLHKWMESLRMARLPQPAPAHW